MSARVMAAPRRLAALACGVVVALAGVGISPLREQAATAATRSAFPGLAPVIVSMNLHTLRTGMTLKTARPQSRVADLEYPPTLTTGIELQWGDGDYHLYVGASTLQPLHRGTFTSLNTGTAGSEFHDLWMSMEGSAFLSGAGRIEVLDLAADTTGQLTRFDILFDLSDATPADDAIGELRMNEPDTVPALSPTAQQFHWPRVAVGGKAYLVTDSFRNTTSEPVAVGTARLSGGASEDYTVRSDTCSNHSVAADAECAMTLAYRPTAPGPRVSTLVVPTNRQQLRIGLTGNTTLGRSTLITSGPDWMNFGQRHTFTPLVGYGYGKVDETTPDHRYYFTGDPVSNSPTLGGLNLNISSTAGPLRIGTHRTDSRKQLNYRLGIEEMYRFCVLSYGSMTVNALKLDSGGQPTLADVSFTEYCRAPSTSDPSGTLHGRLRFQARTDTTAPTPPGHLTVTGHTVHWTRSRSGDLSNTIVRIETGGRSTPTTGLPLSVGSNTSAVLPPLRTGQTYRIAAFSIDRAGNVSKATTKSLIY